MGNLFINILNVAGTNYANSGGVAGLTIIRDERPDYRHNMLGIPNGTPRSQFQPVIINTKSVRIFPIISDHFT